MTTRMASIIANLKTRLSRWSARYLRAPISLTSDDPGKLKNIASANSELVRWSAKVIVGGLIGEVLVLLWFSAERSWLETGLLIITNLVIAVGVFGEDHFAHRAGEVGLRLQQISDEKVAEAGARAAEAERKAAEATLELAKFRSARSLDHAQTERFIEKARVFEGTTFQCGIGSVNSDQFALALHLIDALRKAGWKSSNWPMGQAISSFFGSTIGTGVGPVSNVVIGFSRNASKSLRTTATVIAEALSEEEIKAAAVPMAQQIAAVDMITILIGRKS